LKFSNVSLPLDGGGCGWGGRKRFSPPPLNPFPPGEGSFLRAFCENVIRKFSDLRLESLNRLRVIKNLVYSVIGSFGFVWNLGFGDWDFADGVEINTTSCLTNNVSDMI
jgi:hypothetical protein